MKNKRHIRRARLHSGFTLLELLAVLVIIAILAGMIMGAAQRVIQTARTSQANASSRALRMALINYRHDYNHWPVPSPLPTGCVLTNDVLIAANSDGIANAAIFAMLQSNSSDNTNQFRYMDNTTLYTVYGGQQGTLHAAYQSSATPPVPGGFSVGYLTRNGVVHYFTITINFDLETAEVGKQPGD